MYFRSGISEPCRSSVTGRVRYAIRSRQRLDILTESASVVVCRQRTQRKDCARRAYFRSARFFGNAADPRKLRVRVGCWSRRASFQCEPLLIFPFRLIIAPKRRGKINISPCRQYMAVLSSAVARFRRCYCDAASGVRREERLHLLGRSVLMSGAG